MNNRSKHLPVYTCLVGLLLLSFGFNLILYSRISILQEYIISTNPWVSLKQFDLLEKEIDRLDSEKYQIVPKGE
jgi:hypothetical protein